MEKRRGCQLLIRDLAICALLFIPGCILIFTLDIPRLKLLEGLIKATTLAIMSLGAAIVLVGLEETLKKENRKIVLGWMTTYFVIGVICSLIEAIH